MQFTPRLTAPKSDNKYYIHYTNGGLNTSIKIKGNSVLPNCVGQAQARLLEASKAKATNWKIPACNPGYWIETAIKNGLKVGDTPKLGAVAVWVVENSTNGAGHVAVLEEALSLEDYVCSQSHYNGVEYDTLVIHKSNNYAFKPGYIFKGFIYPLVEWDPTYRVRKFWSDKASQLGAYGTLEYAKNKADENPGYTVYDDYGVVVYTSVKKEEPSFKPYMVRVKVPCLNMRQGPGLSYNTRGFIPIGAYTIVETQKADGYTWGRLKSGAGWIALEYTERV